MKAGDVNQESTHSTLIGYGLFSLVFRPPILFPDRSRFHDTAETIHKDPYGFVGLVTTRGHYENQIRKTTRLLKGLASKNSQFSGRIVFPVPLVGNEDYLVLQNADVQKLMEAHHAVRKKVEYEKSWEGRDLVQLIYPYAGKPLEQFCKKPKNAPNWPDFFRAMTEIGRFVFALHEEGYVHGDLSPNNLLYLQSDPMNAKVTVVDWNMLSPAVDFLQQEKGLSRVGCWSPEHFSLTTTRRVNTEEDCHWVIYAEEMRRYIERLLDFSFSNESKAGVAVRDYFAPYTNEQANPVFQAMYKDLEDLSLSDPAAIGKYHDIRYLIDTIAKCVAGIFPNRTQSQQKQYNFFISLYLAQNLPDRKLYLENPSELAKRLSLILDSCQNADEENAVSSPEPGLTTESERTLLHLMR